MVIKNLNNKLDYDSLVRLINDIYNPKEEKKEINDYNNNLNSIK